MKTITQNIALGVGVAFLVLGILGFIPGLVSEPSAMPSYVEKFGVVSGYGYLLGLFPTNTAVNIVHIAVGIIGIFASISLDSSRFYAGQIGIYCTALTILGIIPFTNTFFGLFPIFGLDVLLHAAVGFLGIYFGFFQTPSLLRLFKQEVREDAVAGEIL